VGEADSPGWLPLESFGDFVEMMRDFFGSLLLMP